MRLHGQVAIVTGGGRGIGRAVARGLAREGARTVVCARTGAQVDAVVAEIQGEGGHALGITGDMTDWPDVEALVAQTTAAFGPVDVLVNNAGGVPSELYDEHGALGLSAQAPCWDEPEATWDRIIAANLKSVFLCTKAVMPQMIARGHGDVVNIGSAMGRITATAGGSYAVAKTAVTAFTQLCAAAARPRGVRVNAVAPGMIATPGNDRLLRSWLPPDTPFPPRESAESVAHSVLYILCEAPRAMNGQSLDTFGIR
jgi:3-oxoacyl-[acyl-carrier protein] reductase